MIVGESMSNESDLQNLLPGGFTIQSTAISSSEFDLIRSLVYEKMGINLSDQKRALVVGRLQNALRSNGFKSFRQYYDHVLSDSSGQALVDLADSISTNYTYFNREHGHFDFLRESALPEVVDNLRRKNSKDIRIWCAASSSGEEPYMLAMILREFFGNEFHQWETGILATDISGTALRVAEEGIYSADKVSRVPLGLKNKYFSKIENNLYSVVDEIKRIVTFRRFNLINKVFPFKQKFDIIFCRNVMIYFDQGTRNELVRKLYANTSRGGFLFVGHSETLDRRDTEYDYVKPAIYRKEY